MMIQYRGQQALTKSWAARSGAASFVTLLRSDSDLTIVARYNYNQEFSFIILRSGCQAGQATNSLPS